MTIPVLDVHADRLRDAIAALILAPNEPGAWAEFQENFEVFAERHKRETAPLSIRSVYHKPLGTT